MSKGFELVVFDLDGVLADFSSSWGYVHAHFGDTNAANVNAYFSGEIDDREFMRRDIALWKSHKPDITIDFITTVLEEIPLIPGAVDTLKKLRENGLKLAILSGGLKPLAQRINDIVEFDFIYINDLEIEASGKLGDEGILNVPLMEKEKMLIELLDDLSLSRTECVAVGDSKVDAQMLKMAGLGIAFCPIDKNLNDLADVVITNKDLKEILKFII